MEMSLLFVVLFLLPALGFLWKGITTKRVSGPSCPGCAYNLYKFGGDECPECGFDLARNGVIPPHNSIRKTLVVLAFVYATLVLMTTALLSEFVRHSIHTTQLTKHINFKSPRSLAYAHLGIVVTGSGWGTGSWKTVSRDEPPPVPLKSIKLIANDNGNSISIDVDRLTLEFTYESESGTKRRTLSPDAIRNWLHDHKMKEPKEIRKATFVSGLKETDFVVGDINEETKLIDHVVRWIASSDRVINGDRDVDPVDLPVSLGESTGRGWLMGPAGPFAYVQSNNLSSGWGPPPQWIVRTSQIVWWLVCLVILIKVNQMVRRSRLRPWMMHRHKQSEGASNLEAMSDLT